MEVYADGEAVRDQALEGKTVGGLLDWIRRGDADRFVVAVRIDGREVADGELEAVLALPLDGCGRLDVETTSARILAASALAQAADVLEEAREHHSAVGELLASSKQVEAMDRLTACFDAWNSAEQALRQASRVAGLNLDADEGPSSPGVLIEKLRGCLNEIQQGLKIRDYVAVADLVEYEMLPVIDDWQAMLVGFQQKLLGQA
ncbi:MAG: hypothetical protein HQ546_07585 [Planctomycetes bacterium]|nr:hypothetical protein [Planctomycetota bacterium]